MIQIRPYHKSPSISVDTDNSTWEITYSITGTLDEGEALNALLSYVPTAQVLDGILLSSRTFNLDPEGHNVWRGKCQWKKRSKEKKELEPGQSSFQFETTAASQLVTHSLRTVQAVRASGTAADFKQAIGYNGTEIAGADIYVPTYSFAETHVLPKAAVTQAYKAQLFRLTGRTNSAPFRFLAAGEVLFLGASGSQRGDEDWEISYRFAGSENMTGLTIGDIIGVNKKGWELLWVYFKDASSENILIKKPEQVNVEEVYRAGNYSDLGIGN